MKQILKILTIMVLFTACNKDTEKDYTNIFRIENESAYSIDILAYDNYTFESETEYSYSPSKVTEYSIDAFSFTQFEDTREGGGTESFMGNPRIDSVVIIFNNEKTLRYSCKQRYLTCQDERNILNVLKFHTKDCPSDNKCVYTYTITQVDYDKAELIE